MSTGADPESRVENQPANASSGGWPMRVGLLLLTICLGCATTSLGNRDHIEITSPHFRVVSSLPREATIEIAEDLELFRAATEATAKKRLRPAPTRIRVYALDDVNLKAHFRRAGDPNYLIPSIEGDVIVLRVGKGWRADYSFALRHALTHALIRQHEGLDLPLWYDEGLAQFASTTQIRRDVIRVAGVLPDNLRMLRLETWISMERVLSARDLEDWSRRARDTFAAQSWALIHYSQPSVRRPESALSAFFDDLQKGRIGKAETIRGPLAEALDDVLIQYAKRKLFPAMNVKVETPWVAEADAVRPLSAAEARTRLAELAIALGRPKDARRFLEDALADPEISSGERALAMADLGRALQPLGQGDEAARRWQEAVALAPDDPQVRRAAGLGAVEAVLAASGPSADASQPLRQRAQTDLLRAQTLDPRDPSIYVGLARLALARGEDPFEMLELARRLIPGSLELELLRTRMALASDRPVLARLGAVTVISYSHSPRQIREARDLLEEALDRGVAPH